RGRLFSLSARALLAALVPRAAREVLARSRAYLFDRASGGGDVDANWRARCARHRERLARPQRPARYVLSPAAAGALRRDRHRLPAVLLPAVRRVARVTDRELRGFRPRASLLLHTVRRG